MQIFETTIGLLPRRLDCINRFPARISGGAAVERLFLMDRYSEARNWRPCNRPIPIRRLNEDMQPRHIRDA
jgi:hypothetical protein